MEVTRLGFVEGITLAEYMRRCEDTQWVPKQGENITPAFGGVEIPAKPVEAQRPPQCQFVQPNSPALQVKVVEIMFNQTFLIKQKEKKRNAERLRGKLRHRQKQHYLQVLLRANCEK